MITLAKSSALSTGRQKLCPVPHSLLLYNLQDLRLVGTNHFDIFRVVDYRRSSAVFSKIYRELLDINDPSYISFFNLLSINMQKTIKLNWSWNLVSFVSWDFFNVSIMTIFSIQHFFFRKFQFISPNICI